MGSLFSLSNVSVVRDGKRILGPLDLSVDEGESIAVIGRNGSGKTTLSMLLRREIAPYNDDLAHSDLTISGRKDWDIFELRKIVVSVSTDDERFFDPNEKVAEVIMTGFFGSDAIYPIHTITGDMRERVRTVASLTGVVGLLDRPFGTLSQGERRCTIISRALIPDPKVMILDEPTNSLDPVASAQFIDMIGSLIDKGLSVVMITHKLEDIPKGIRRVIGMRGGLKVADGVKEDVLTSKTVSDIYGASAEVLQEGGVYTLRLSSENI